MKIIIRYAEESDLDTVFQIEKQSLDLWKRTYFETELETTFSSFIIAEYKEEIIGFAIAWNIPGEIQLNNIAVRREFRRMGIASQLINFIIETLKPKGAQRIFLETQTSNKEALKFYKRLGFYKTGLRKNYYQNDDAILLDKEI